MDKLPFRNESFIAGDLVIPNKEYSDFDTVGIVLETDQKTGNITVYWQTPTTDSFGKLYELETLPEWMFTRVA